MADFAFRISFLCSFSAIASACYFRKRSPRRFTKPRLSLESATSSLALLLRRAERIPGAQSAQVNNSPLPTTLSEINTPSLSASWQRYLSGKMFGNTIPFFRLNDRQPCMSAGVLILLEHWREQRLLSCLFGAPGIRLPARAPTDRREGLGNL